MVISNLKEMENAFLELIENDTIRAQKGLICSAFVQENRGATNTILKKV
jgi:3-deoxy-D-manno-octulosonic-acid transferase